MSAATDSRLEIELAFVDGTLVGAGEVLARVKEKDGVATPVGPGASTPATGPNVRFDAESGRFESTVSGYPSYDGTTLRIEPLVIVADDEMSATLILRPVPGLKTGLTKAKLLQRIEESGVVFGVVESAVTQALERHAEAPGETHSAPIARGKTVLPGCDGRVTLSVEVGSRAGRKTQDGRVDFHHLSLCRDVLEGELLAYRVQPTEGSAGRTVTGMLQLPPPGTDEKLAAGDGVKVEKGGLEFRAAKDGILFVKDGCLRVLEAYAVDGNVDFATGDIETRHRVVIKGSVLSAFAVQAGGPISIDQHAEDAFIDSGAWIEVKGGIVHGEIGSVSAKEDVRARYAQNARIQAQGSIELADSAVRSVLVAGDAIRLCRGKGVLLGGKAIAGNLIEVNTAGSKQGIPTVIHAGHDHQAIAPVERKLRELGRDMAGLTKQIGRDLAGYVRGEKAIPESPRIRKLLRHWGSLEKRRRALWRQRDVTLQRSAARLSKNPTILIRRVLHPGVTLIMGRARMVVTRERPGGRFVYCRKTHTIMQA